MTKKIVCTLIVIFSMVLCSCADVNVDNVPTALTRAENTTEPTPELKPTPSPTPKSTEEIYQEAIRYFKDGEHLLAQKDFETIKDYKSTSRYLEEIHFVKDYQGTWVNSADELLVFKGMNLIYHREKSVSLRICNYEEEQYLVGSEGVWVSAFKIEGSKLIEYYVIGYRDGRIENIKAKYQIEYTKKNDSVETTLKRKPYIGMTRKQLKNDCTWGKPNDINKTTTAYGVSEQWCYSGYGYVYLKDGVVTAIQE